MAQNKNISMVHFAQYLFSWRLINTQNMRMPAILDQREGNQEIAVEKRQAYT